jgi:hypothetical protein
MSRGSQWTVARDHCCAAGGRRRHRANEAFLILMPAAYATALAAFQAIYYISHAAIFGTATI